MKTLYDKNAAAEVKQRIGALSPTTARQWGKMTPAQMLAHCSMAMKTAIGDTVLPRMFIGRILGPFVRSGFSNDKPLSQNGPTAPSFIIADERDFGTERDRLIQLIDRFSAGGTDNCTKSPHCFFGKLSSDEWGKGMYKHLDHHLRQFGV